MASRNFTGFYVVLGLIGFGVGLLIGDRYAMSNLEKEAKKAAVESMKGQLPQWVQDKYGDTEATRDVYSKALSKAGDAYVEKLKAQSFRDRFRDLWQAYLIFGGLGFGGGCFAASMIQERVKGANHQRNRCERQDRKQNQSE